ncbi:hypothetical protein IH992_05325 [Candidatus Poribacteria bacterium]|nr:hypothetical protein [Candidatus Poribacteria bacterium]
MRRFITCSQTEVGCTSSLRVQELDKILIKQRWMILDVVDVYDYYTRERERLDIPQSFGGGIWTSWKQKNYLNGLPMLVPFRVNMVQWCRGGVELNTFECLLLA